MRKRYIDPTFTHIILKRIPIVVLLLFVCCPVIGQGSSHYLNYTIQDGLPSNRIYSVIQNKEGYVYIGTDKGLCKFDGVSFDYFGYESGLPNLEILALYLDKKDRMWISSFSEQPLFIYSDSLHIVSTVPKQNPTIFSYGFIEPDTLVAYTKLQAFYLNINSYALYRIVKLNSRVTGAVNTPSYYSYLNDNRINMRFKDNLIQYRPDHRYVVVNPFLYGRRPVFSKLAPYINTFGPFKGGRGVEGDSLLFARSSKGLLTFTIKDTLLSNHYLEDANIFGLDRDWQNRLLVGTKNKGLFIIDNKVVQCKNQISKTYRLDRASIFRPDPQSYSSIIIYSQNGHFQVLDFDAQQVNHISLRTPDIVTDFTVRKSRPNLLLIPPYLFKSDYQKGLIEIDSFTRQDNVKELLELDDNHSCVFSNRILLYNNLECIDTINYSPNVRTLCTQRLNDSIFVVGTLSGFHIFEYNPHGSILSKFNSHPLNPISSIIRINNEELCVSSDAFGVKCFHLREKELVELSHWHPGNDFIKQFTLDGRALLALSNKGLYRLSFPHLKLLDFIEIKSGTPIRHFTKKNEHLFIAGEDFAQIYQGNISSQDSKAKLHILQVSNNSKTVDPLNLGAHQANLDIKLSIPYFSQKTPSIHYKLEGADEQELVTNDRIIRLRNLTSGHYTFIAQAYVGGKPISQKVYLPIEIRPVFWKTWWFICLVILFITSLIYYYFQQTKYKQQAKTALLQQRLNALHAQMNPHFLFNALQSLQYYISKNDTKRTNTYLSTFATLVRKTLESSAQEYILLKDEVDYLTSYLEMEKEKLDGNLLYTFVCNDSLKRSKMIPTMIIQPFVENSIVHGFGSRSTSNLIQISFEQTTSKEVRCEITDNGTFKVPHTSKTEHKSFSSKAVENRIKLLYQLHETSSSRNKTAIQILSNVAAGSIFEEGTTVRLTIPCIQAST